MLSDIDVLRPNRTMSDQDKFMKIPGCKDRRCVTVGNRTLYLFAFEYSSARHAEYLITKTVNGFDVRVIWPHMPEALCDGIDLDIDGLLPGAPFANLETAIMGAKNWEREHQHALGPSSHSEGVAHSGEDQAFLILDTIYSARIGWFDGQKVFFYHYRIRDAADPEFMVYAVGHRFEVALVRPSLSRTDRWLLKMTQDTINMAHTFGEPCINLETAILRSQLWADQCKARLVGAGT